MEITKVGLVASRGALLATLLATTVSVSALDEPAVDLSGADSGWHMHVDTTLGTPVYRAVQVRDVGLGHQVAIALSMRAEDCASLTLTMAAKGSLIPRAERIGDDPITAQIGAPESDTGLSTNLYPTSLDSQHLNLAAPLDRDNSSKLMETLSDQEKLRVRVRWSGSDRTVRFSMRGYDAAIGEAQALCKANRAAPVELAHAGWQPRS